MSNPRRRTSAVPTSARRITLLSALALALLYGALGTAPPVRAGGGCCGISIQMFVAALNQGDVTAVMAQMAPEATITMRDGVTISGAALRPFFEGLPRPVSIVSVTPSPAPLAGSGPQHGPHVLSAVLRFGSGPEQAVKFTGSGERRISTMIMLAPAAGAAMDSAQVRTLAATLQSPPRLPAAGSGGLLPRRPDRGVVNPLPVAVVLAIFGLGGVGVLLLRSRSPLRSQKCGR